MARYFTFFLKESYNLHTNLCVLYIPMPKSEQNNDVIKGGLKRQF